MTPYRRGAKAIAEYLGCSVNSAFHQLERGLVPGAAKQGGAWLLDTRLFDEAHRMLTLREDVVS